jgi:hypothetical protein
MLKIILGVRGRDIRRRCLWITPSTTSILLWSIVENLYF